MDICYFQRRKPYLSAIHCISNNETHAQAKRMGFNSSKTVNWTIINRSHNEIKPHRILSPHSF